MIRVLTQYTDWQVRDMSYQVLANGSDGDTNSFDQVGHHVKDTKLEKERQL